MVAQARSQLLEGSTENGGSGTLTAVRGEHRTWWLRHAHSCKRWAQNMVDKARSQLFEGSTEHGSSGTLTAVRGEHRTWWLRHAHSFRTFIFSHFLPSLCTFFPFLLRSSLLKCLQSFTFFAFLSLSSHNILLFFMVWKWKIKPF